MPKKKDVEKELALINENRNKFDYLKKFINENHELVTNYRKKCLSMLWCGAEDGKEKCRRILIDSLNAGGTGNLDEKAKTIKELFDEDKKNIDSGSKLIEKLFKEKIKGLGPKKCGLAALSCFIEEWIDEDGIKNIPNIVVPVDRVVATIFDEIYGTNLKEALGNQSELVHEKITEFAKGVFGKEYSEYSKLDDLWFWGHFSIKRKRNENNQWEDEITPNKSQIEIDLHLPKTLFDSRMTKNDFEKNIEKFITEINKTKYYNLESLNSA